MPYLIALFLLISTTAPAAQPARVIDGNSLELATGEQIRLIGIDAPERAEDLPARRLEMVLRR